MMLRRREYDFAVIGRNLRNRRQALNLTVEEVREAMQLGTVQSVYKWERGEGLPQADTFLALLEFYGVYDFRKITEESDELSSVHFRAA